MVITLCAVAAIVSAGAANDKGPVAETRISVVVVRALNTGALPAEKPVDATARTDAGGSPLRKGYASGGTSRRAEKLRQQFDPGLEKVKSALAELPYDTFRLVKSSTMKVELNKESVQQITNTYVLHVTPIEKDDEGRLRVKVWIEQKRVDDPEASSRRAIDTTSALAEGKPLVLGGLTLDGSSLAVVLTVED